MHPAAFEYVSQFATCQWCNVVEIGSRDINGSVRPLFSGAYYLGIDLSPGPSVDVVCDACEYTPATAVDLVICCEVLEHSERWTEILRAAYRWLFPGGRLIMTCAGPGRKEHSAIDGGPLRPGEYYRNLSVSEVTDALQDAGFRTINCRANGEDTQATAVK